MDTAPTLRRTRLRRVLAPLHLRLLPAEAARFSREAALLLVALALLNGSNYALHVVLSRLLGPAEYGGLAALLAVLMVLSVPFGVVQTVIAKRTAALRGAGRHDEIAELAGGTTKALGALTVPAALLLAAASPALALFVGIGPGTAILLAPYALLAVLASVPLGVLQGRLQFRGLAAVTLAGVAVRLGAATGLVALGLGIEGAILATLLAQATTAALAAAALRLPRGSWRRSRWTLGCFRGELATAVLGLSGFWLLAEVDIMLARHYLDPEQAGIYSAAGILARALLFLPAAISIVALPRFAEDRRRADSFRWLRLALTAVLVLVLVGLAGLALLRGPLVRLAFGDGFADAASLVPLLGVAAGLLAVVNLLVYFHIAVGTRAHWFLFAGVALELILTGFFHGSGEQIALVLIGVSALVAGLQLHAAVALARSAPPPLERRGALAGLLRPEGPELELSVVLPCHNAAAALPGVLRGVLRQLAEVESHEVIVVSDGSTDDTAAVASAFATEGVRVLTYGERAGKGAALRLGLSEAKGRYVAFLDGDGDIDPASVRAFVELMNLYQPDIVLGSKRHPLSEVSYPPARRVLSWGYHKLTRLLFRVDVRDTQTGCKLIRREVLEAVLPRMVERRFAFDLELLVVARRLGFTRLFEAPVRIEHGFSSHVDLRAVSRIFLDTFAIFYRRYLLNAYPRDEGAGRPALVATPAVARRPDPVASGPNNRARRVLILNWRDIANPESGGAEVFTHEVARRWVAQGHEVSLLTSGFPGGRRVESLDGVHVRRIGRLRNGSFHARVQLELARLRGFDVVIDEINTIPFLTPLWSGRLPPVVALIHQLAREVWAAELPRPAAAVGCWLEPRLLGLYRDVPVVAISDSTRADLDELGFSNVRVVPAGRDAPPVLDADALEKPKEPTFIFVGRLAANKRPGSAVEAFRHIRGVLPNARLWVVGRGPLYGELETALPEGAELLGHLPRAELYERLARAHCLLIPSVREGWGLVVIEANSVGTPAVGCDVPGIRDSIRHGRTGLLAPAAEPAALARTAIELLADPVRYQAMRRNAIDWAQRFSWDATAERLLEILEAEVVRSAGLSGWQRTPAHVHRVGETSAAGTLGR